MYPLIRDLHYGPPRVLNSVNFQKFHYLNSYPRSRVWGETNSVGIAVPHGQNSWSNTPDTWYPHSSQRQEVLIIVR